VELQTRYARSGDARLAYQVFGDGPIDLVSYGGPALHLDVIWEYPGSARWYERMAGFARVLVYDRRGTGMSDPLDGPLTLEGQMDDLRAVIKAAGFDRPAISAGGDAARIAMLYAATYPDEVRALSLNGASASGVDAIDEAVREQILDFVESSWGEGRTGPLMNPSHANDQVYLRWMAKVERTSMSPAVARRFVEFSLRSDVRAILGDIRVPTAVIHRRNDAFIPVERARELAERIPGAKLVLLDGVDTMVFAGDVDAFADEVEAFLTGTRPAREPDRVLTTVLFTDIVDSTARAAKLGDSRWRRLLDDHDRIAREEVERERGRWVKGTGDGVLATFDGPARAIRAAQAIERATDAVGVSVRAGVHTGEVELMGDDLGGIAVHIGARISALAEGGEVLVSSTVRELVIGSQLEFADRGAHELKGVPGEWRVYALVS
jgi:class 3 adenylate cyclase